MMLGQCVNNAPVAFLNNFEVECVTLLQACPSEPHLQTQVEDLMIQVKNGQGGVFNLLTFFAVLMSYSNPRISIFFLFL